MLFKLPSTLHLAVSLLLATGALASDGVAPKPRPRQDARGLHSARQGGGTISGILGGYLAAQFASVFGSPAYCCEDSGGDVSDPCMCWGDTAGAGQICWNKGAHVWSAADSQAANCLAALHTSDKKDQCISIAGTICAEGYSGPILNAHTDWLMQPYNLNSQDATAIDFQFDMLAGTQVGVGKDDHVAGVSLAKNGSPSDGIWITFKGGKGC